MSNYEFSVVDIFAEPYAAAPQLTARLRIQESTGQTIHAIALRCQVRIEPQRRRYEEADESGLRALFGERDRWAETLKPFLWMQSSAMVQGFTEITEVDLPLPCTYDFEVTGSRYLHAVTEGTVPLALLFSGTVFTKGANRVRSRAGALGLRGELCAAGRRVAADDRVLLPEHRLDPTRPRRAHLVGRLQVQPGPDHVGRDPADPAGRARRCLAMSLDHVRSIADAVLYEGYLLYPYRATSSKNQSRWQFGVLGPPAASAESFGEAPRMSMQCLLERPDETPGAKVTAHLRFLQLQVRTRRGAQG